MGMRLNTVIIFLFILCLVSCSKNHDIEDDWGGFDNRHNYCEFYISNNKIRIYLEDIGSLGQLDYKINNDSLFTNGRSNYKISWINKDSVNLSSLVNNDFLYLKRIKNGFKLSDFINETLEEKYINAFYRRMNTAKGLKKKHDTIQINNREIIYIDKK